MSGLPLLLPQPPASVTAVTLYVLVGIAVCALVTLPLPAHSAHPGGDRFGIEPVRAVIVVVVCVALWPAALLWTTIRNSLTRAAAVRAQRSARVRARRSALRTVMRSDDEAAEQPVYLAQPTRVGHTTFDDEQWAEAAAARVVDALTERRLLVAVLGARSLVWDVEFAFGPSCHQLWNATELLAHACHEIGDDVRAVQLYARRHRMGTRLRRRAPERSRRLRARGRPVGEGPRSRCDGLCHRAARRRRHPDVARFNSATSLRSSFSSSRSAVVRRSSRSPASASA